MDHITYSFYPLVTLQWNQPVGRGTEAVIDSFYLTIEPNVLFGEKEGISVYYSLYKAALTYNTEFIVNVSKKLPWKWQSCHIDHRENR